MTTEDYDSIIMCLMIALSDKERPTKEHVMATLFTATAVLALSLGCPNGESFAQYALGSFEETKREAAKELEIKQLNKMVDPN